MLLSVQQHMITQLKLVFINQIRSIISMDFKKTVFNTTHEKIITLCI
jgi:hypothetical protein